MEFCVKLHESTCLHWSFHAISVLCVALRREAFQIASSLEWRTQPAISSKCLAEQNTNAPNSCPMPDQRWRGNLGSLDLILRIAMMYGQTALPLW